MLEKRRIEEIAYDYTVTNPSPLLGTLTDLQTNTINSIIKAYMARHPIFIKHYLTGKITTADIFLSEQPIENILLQLDNLIRDHRNQTYLADILYKSECLVKWSDQEYVLINLMSQNMRIEYRKLLLTSISKVYAIPDMTYRFSDNQFNYYGTLQHKDEN